MVSKSTIEKWERDNKEAAEESKRPIDYTPIMFNGRKPFINGIRRYPFVVPAKD